MMKVFEPVIIKAFFENILMKSEGLGKSGAEIFFLALVDTFLKGLNLLDQKDLSMPRFRNSQVVTIRSFGNVAQISLRNIRKFKGDVEKQCLEGLVWEKIVWVFCNLHFYV